MTDSGAFGKSATKVSSHFFRSFSISPAPAFFPTKVNCLYLNNEQSWLLTLYIEALHQQQS